MTKQTEESKRAFHMIDVSKKPETRRRAIAEGRITMSKEAFLCVKEDKLPKGNPLALAEAAGVMAAKRTPELIPLCHPLGLEKVSIRTALDESSNSVIVQCIALATAKTGVEMEALSGVNAALLTIYDLVKGT